MLHNVCFKRLVLPLTSAVHATTARSSAAAVALMTSSSPYSRLFSTSKRGDPADAKAAEDEFAALGSLEADIANAATEKEDNAVNAVPISADSLLHSAQQLAKAQFADEELSGAHKTLSGTSRQYTESVKKLVKADATASTGVKINSLGANPYGWDIESREVKEAPLWMLYEAGRQEERITDKTAGRKAPRIDNETEIRMPMRDEKGRAYATGRRKTAVARVWVSEGDGKFVVNGRNLTEYFPRLHDRKLAMEPLIVTEACGAFDVYLTVSGGGLTGQAGAAKHGLANALARFDPQLKPVLRRFEMIQRDPRMVERKKPGQKKARKKFQWIKR